MLTYRTKVITPERTPLPVKRDALVAAILAEGDVDRACARVGITRAALERRLAEDNELQRALVDAGCHILFDISAQLVRVTFVPPQGHDLAQLRETVSAAVRAAVRGAPG